MNRYSKVGKKIEITEIARSSRKIKKIAVHCLYTPSTMDVGAKEVHEWHKERGWSGIGYHFIIRRDGSVEIGRGIDYIGAHVRGNNRNTIGIAYAGGAKRDGKKLVTDYDNLSNEQKSALFTLAHYLSEIHGLKKDKILGHCEFPRVYKSCPNLNMQALRDMEHTEEMLLPEPSKFNLSEWSERNLKSRPKEYQKIIKSLEAKTKMSFSVYPDGTVKPLGGVDPQKLLNELVVILMAGSEA